VAKSNSPIPTTLHPTEKKVKKLHFDIDFFLRKGLVKPRSHDSPNYMNARNIRNIHIARYQQRFALGGKLFTGFRIENGG
jgi:hypothetical protein